jgi:carbamoyl-phosphate synthase small subunit
LKGADLAKLVTTKQPYQWNQGTIWPERPAVYSKRIATFHVVAVDYGIKRNILRLLADLDCRVTVVPATTSVDEMLELNPDGVFLSNGPGDPEASTYAIEAVQSLLRIGIPMFGICLGHQLIGLATGAKTVKMKFGHHGANHPVVEIDSGRVLITSQNHGFSVDEATLPDNVRPTHRSLFDGSLQGIEIANAPAFAFQGHPEGSPGPHDLTPLFRRFAAMMKEHRRVAIAAAG